MTEYTIEVLEALCQAHGPLKLAQVAASLRVPMWRALRAIEALRAARLVLRVTGDGVSDIARYVATPVACKLMANILTGDGLSKQILDGV